MMPPLLPSAGTTSGIHSLSSSLLFPVTVDPRVLPAKTGGKIKEKILHIMEWHKDSNNS